MKFKHVQLKQSDGNGGGTFLKVEEGKSVNVVFRGDVFEFYQVWPQGGTKQVFTEPTAGASMRFKVNAIVHEDGKFVAKLWEFPPTVSNLLFEISQEVDLTKTKCKLSRVGSGKKTQWVVIPLGPLDAKALKAIDAVELLPLKPSSLPAQEPSGAPGDEF
jgi:hypothetical protein